MTQTNENFFQKIEDEAVKIVEGIFGKVENTVIPIEQSISKFGNSVVNEFKTLSVNPEVATMADWFVKIAEGIDPALTPIISGIELAFPKIVNIATGILGEINKPVKDQLSDGLTAIENTKAANSTLGANILGGINAAVQAYAISNNATSMTPVSDSQLIVAAHIVHAQVA
jgi:hypothetical protein